MSQNRDLAVIKRAFERPDVDRLIDVKTVHLGPAEILIAAKVDIAAKQEEVGYESLMRLKPRFDTKWQIKKSIFILRQMSMTLTIWRNAVNLCDLPTDLARIKQLFLLQ